MARNNKFTRNIDKIIGTKIHELRLVMGLSRKDLSTKIDVTHQQIQKYEKGSNRISASRLVLIAKAFGKPTSFFFDNAEETHQALPSQHQRMCIEVSRNFMRIKSPMHQNAINFLVRSLMD